MASAYPAFDGPVILFQNIIEVLSRYSPLMLTAREVRPL